MPKKQKLLFVYDAIYPYVKGGAERRYYELGKRLGSQGFEVHLYGMKFWDGPKVIKRDGLTLHGIMQARPLYTKSGRRSISQAILFGLSAFQLLWADFDVIDCCGFPYFSMFPAKLAATIKGKPLFATWHEVWGKQYWNEYLGVLGAIGYGVERLASRLPTAIIAVSDMTAQRLKYELGYNRAVTVVPNGIDYDHISKIKAAKGKFDVIYVGRLMDFKNVDMLIRSIAELQKQGSEIKCRIVGEGPEEASLKALAQQLKLEGLIHWSGFMKNSDDVYALMKASKVLILPSSREGFGMVALEANSCGIPVLTANFADNAAKDLIKGGVNGYVFEPIPESLETTLNKALKGLKKLQHTASRWAKSYDWDGLSSRLVEVYKV